MKRTTLVIFIFLASSAALYSQEKNKTLRWSVNAGLQVSDLFNLLSLGGSCTILEHHSLGFSAGIVPEIPMEINKHHAASADYRYYFRPLGKHSFNFFVMTSVDYDRYKSTDPQVFDITITSNEQSTLFLHPGAGVSYKANNNFFANLGVCYLVGYQFSATIKYNDENGNSRVSSNAYHQIWPPHVIPWVLNLRVGYLFK